MTDAHKLTCSVKGEGKRIKSWPSNDVRSRRLHNHRNYKFALKFIYRGCPSHLKANETPAFRLEMPCIFGGFIAKLVFRGIFFIVVINSSVNVRTESIYYPSTVKGRLMARDYVPLLANNT